MTTHTSTEKGTSQCDLILAALEAANGRDVGLFDLWRASGSMAVHSRISDLRERGHEIENRTEHQGGRVLSFYRLVKLAPTEPQPQP